jgi:hypothetical protein
LYTNLTQVNDSATPETLGYVNGIAQFFASFARALGPALGGIIWAWGCQNGLPGPFDHRFIFLVINVVVAGLLVHSYVLLKE